MSRPNSIALVDEMIAKLTEARDEMQKRHDATTEQQADAKSATPLHDLASHTDKAISRLKAWVGR